MAKLLIRVGDQSSLPDTFKDSDVVAVFDDGHIFGREESLDVWVAEGRDAADWSGKFMIISAPNMAAATAAKLVARGADGAQRATQFNYRALAKAPDLLAGKLTVDWSKAAVKTAVVTKK